MYQATTMYMCLVPGAYEPSAFCSSCAHISAHTRPSSCALSSNTNAPHTHCCPTSPHPLLSHIPTPIVAPHPPTRCYPTSSQKECQKEGQTKLEQALLLCNMWRIIIWPEQPRAWPGLHLLWGPGFSTDSVPVSAFHVSNTLCEQFQCVHCQLDGQANELADLRMLVTTLQAEVSQLRDKGSS